MRGLGLRLALAGAGAAVAIVGLEWVLRSRDANQAAAAQDPPDVPGTQSRAEAGMLATDVVLGASLRDLEGAAAVWQLLADGTTALRRPPRLSSAPLRQRLPAIGIVLPCRALSALTPVQRAGLLDLLAQLWPERPVPEARLRLQGVDGRDSDIRSLLGWLR